MDIVLPALATAVVGATIAATALGGAIARRTNLGEVPRGRIGCVDGLRGYLALMVMVYHFVLWVGMTRLGTGWSEPSQPILASLGSGPVAIFFMITGLLFHRVVMRGVGGTFWPAFYTGRVFRIMPLVLLSIAAVLALILWRQDGAIRSPLLGPLSHWLIGYDEPDLMGHANSMILNAGVLWSIFHEWVFYVVTVPLAAIAADLARGRMPAWTVPALLFGGLFVLTRFHEVRGLGGHLPLFPLGMLASTIAAQPQAAALLRRREMALPALLALVLAMAVWPNAKTLAPMLLYAGFLTTVAAGNSLFGMLETAGARVLGACSFGIYLLHGSVLALLFQAGTFAAALGTTGVMVLLPLAALIVPLIAVAAALLVEQPAIVTGRGVAMRLQAAWDGLDVKMPVIRTLTRQGRSAL